jgi:hypothetical protein
LPPPQHRVNLAKKYLRYVFLKFKIAEFGQRLRLIEGFMKTKSYMILICMLLLLVFEAGCKPSPSRSPRTVYGAPADRAALVYKEPEQKTANYVSTSNNEIDRLQIAVTRERRPAKNIIDAFRSGYVLTGYFEISTKKSGGEIRVRRIPITGEVATNGVPSTITIPSSIIGVPDRTLGCFFDRSLNLRLVGDNRRSFPRIMYRVK